MRKLTKLTFSLGTLVVTPAMFLPSVVANQPHHQTTSVSPMLNQSLNLGRAAQFSQVPTFNNHQIIKTLEDHNGNLWVATATDGLYESTDGGGSFTKTPSFTSTSQIKSFYQDHNGNLWVATATDGLYESTDGSSSFSKLSTLKQSDVNLVYESSDETIWVDTSQGLYKSTDGGGSFTKTPSFTTGRVTSIYQDNQSVIWVGYSEYLGTHTLYKSVNSGNTFKPVNFGWHRDISGFYQTIDHVFWVATSQGLYKSTDYGANFKVVTNLGSGSVVSAFCQDVNQKIWVGETRNGEDGLFTSVDGTTFTQINNWPTNKLINDAFQDTRDILWIGTNGLYKTGFGYGVHFGTNSNEAQVTLDGHLTTVTNKPAEFWTNDTTINNIVINGKTYHKGVDWFNYPITKGKYQITINYTTASKITSKQLYYWVKQGFAVNPTDFTTDSGYTIKQYHGYLNQDFNRGAEVVAVLNPHQVGQAVLNVTPSDPTFNAATSFYQGVNPKTFEPTGPKTRMYPGKTTIIKDGLYKLTLTDVVGNTATRYLQVGGTKLLIAQGFTATKITAAKPVPAPTPHQYTPGWIIALIVIGSLVGLSTVVWGGIRFTHRDPFGGRADYKAHPELYGKPKRWWQRNPKGKK